VVIILGKSAELQLPTLLYVAGASFWGLALLRRAPLRAQWRGVASFMVAAASVALLYELPWSRREQFLNDLYSIQPGSPVAEVRHIMAGYLVGSGVPGRDGTGEVVVPDAIIFRHSTAPEYNSEWGVVHFREGRVTEVSHAYD